MSDSKEVEAFDSGPPDKYFGILAADTEDPEPIIAIIVQKIVPFSADKLVLINYADNPALLTNIPEKLKQNWHGRPFCPAEIVAPHLNTKSLSEAESLVNGCSDNDIIIFLNLTNILPAQAQLGTSTTKGGLSLNLGALPALNWEFFRKKVLDLWSSTSANIFFHVRADKDTQDKLMSTFKDDDIDIYCLSVRDQAKITTQQVIDRIRSLPYDEGMTSIESLRSELDLNSYLYARVMLCVHHHNNTEAVTLLEENYTDLNGALRRLLADLHSSLEDGGPRTFEILADLIDNHPNTQGLYESVSRCVFQYRPQDGENLIDTCLTRDPENTKVLRNAAGFYAANARHADAESLHNTLFKTTGDPRHLLSAEISSIMKDDKIDKHHAEERIVAFADSHKNDSALYDESFFRLGLLWLTRFNSHFKALQSLLKVSDSLNNKFAAEAARLKLETVCNLLSRKPKSIGAAKPARYSDLQSFYGDLLVSSIPALTLDAEGLLTWRDFIEKVQDRSSWQRSMREILFSIFSAETVQTIRSLADKSYCQLDPQINNDESSIYFVRFHRLDHPPEEFWDQSQEHINEMLDPDGPLFKSLILRAQSPIEECFVRYQLAILASDRGRTQVAQNHALTLWAIANQAPEALSRKARVLGLIAWGYARSRSGDSTEGIACLLSSVPLAIKCEEVGPLIEDGYRTFLYWALNSKVFTEEQMVIVEERLKTPGLKEFRSETYSLFRQQKWRELLELLSDHIATEERGPGWAVDFIYYVQAAYHSGRHDEARRLILLYHSDLIKAFEARKNFRPIALDTMAKMILSTLTDDNLEESLQLAKRLLDQAVVDIEAHRGQFPHKDERARWVDATRHIYSNHATITVMCALRSEARPLPGDVLSIMNRVNLRSLLENRRETGQLSPELATVEKEYWDLVAHQARASATGTPLNYVGSEYAEHIKEVQRTVIENHPRYKSLPLVSDLTEHQLRERIAAEEVLCQVVVGEIWSASMIVTQSQVILDVAFIGKKEVEKHVKAISKYMMSMPHGTLAMSDFLSSIDVLSKELFGPLIEFLNRKEITRVYLCKDVALGMFSSSLIRVNGDWLDERVSSIRNIISPAELIRDAATSEPKYDIRSFVFGPTTDRAISKISAWQKRTDIAEMMIVDSLDTARPRDELQRLRSVSPYIAFIAGHGVHDTIKHGGAISIKSTKELISASDLNPILKTCECAIVLSCSGGQPVSTQPESGEGIWAGIVGSGPDSALLCTWDVDAQASLGMIEYLLKFERSKFSAVLTEVKRAMIRTTKYSNPYFWAGYGVLGGRLTESVSPIAGDGSFKARRFS